MALKNGFENRKVCGDNINLQELFDSNKDNTLMSKGNYSGIAGFCQDSASVLQEFIAQLEPGAVIDASEKVFCNNIISCRPQPDQQCDLESELRV